MDAVLITEWLDGAPSIPMLDTASVSLARDRVRSEGARIGLPSEVTAKLVNVASELATNQLAHARGGSMAIAAIERDGVAGLEVRAADRGPGIADPIGAFRGGESRAGTLGIGLAAVAELALEIDVDVRLGEGTSVRARAFASEVPRRREVGVFSRPYPGERVSGDGAFVKRTKRGLLAIVVDGLGHGDEAREATDAAVAAARDAADRGPDAIFAACHAATTKTRGVAMTLAEIDDAGELVLAGVGNVAGYVVGPQLTSRFMGAAGTVGAPGPLRRIGTERRPLSPYDVVLLYTDGLTSRLSFDKDADVLRDAPIAIAQRTFERFARDNDDALVLVAR